MERFCSDCGEKLVGRADKKFCNDQCRNNFNNKVNSDTNSVMRNINNVLRKNRRIMEKYYGFVIDTNNYSGNFEREIAAYLTGVAPYRGNEYIRKDFEYPDYVVKHVLSGKSEHEEDICEIYPTPDWYNNGLGFAFKEGEEQIAFEKHNEYVKNYKLQHPTTSLNELSSIDKLRKYSCYNSVIIYFDELTDEMIEYLKKEAMTFEMKDLQITGFRKVEFTLTEEIVNI